jgi:hypothetical protein
MTSSRTESSLTERTGNVNGPDDDDNDNNKDNDDDEKMRSHFVSFPFPCTILNTRTYIARAHERRVSLRLARLSNAQIRHDSELLFRLILFALRNKLYNNDYVS